MGGGNSHRRAVERAKQKRLKEEVKEGVTEAVAEFVGNQQQPASPKPTEDNILLRLPVFIEQPLFLLPVGTIGGIVGFFFYAPVFIVCGICFVLAFHRARVVAGYRWYVQVPSYVLLCAVVVGGLYFLRFKLDKKLAEQNISLAQLIANTISPILFGKMPTNAPPKPQVSADQLEVIGQLDQFLIRHDELELRKQFGFEAMTARNIQMVRDRIVAFRKTGDKYNFDITPYQFDGGQMLLETKELPARRIGPGGVGVGPLPADRVFLIMLPKEYVDGRAKLSEYERSSVLPGSIISAVKEFDAAVEKNAQTLRSVLDSALQENPDNFLLHDDVDSFYWRRIDALYREKRLPLSPRADAVRSAIRKFLGVI